MKTTILRSIILSMLALALGLTLMIGSTAFAAEGAAYQSALDTTDMFTDRDLAQTADLADAIYYSVSSGEDIHIDAAGVYVLGGSASNVTVYVEAGDEDKVQLVLDGVEITNDDFPCIYVKSADKVIITTSADSALSVTGTFTADGETNTDGVMATLSIVGHFYSSSLVDYITALEE